MIYTRSYLGFSVVCVQRTLCLLLPFVTPNLRTKWWQNGTYEVGFLSQPIEPTMPVVSSKFVLITGRFRQTLFVM